MKISILALLGLAGLSAGCNDKSRDAPKPVDPPVRAAPFVESFKELCGPGGKPFDGSKAYAKGTDPNAPSRVAVFTKDTSDTYELAKKETLPALAPLMTDTANEVELVVCVDSRQVGEPNVCRYKTGVLQHFDKTHAVRVIEAKTGKVVAKEELTLSRRSNSCPELYFTTDDAKVESKGVDPSPRILATLLPLEPAGAGWTEMRPAWLTSVCSGNVFPLQTTPYNKDSKEKRSVAIAYFPNEGQPQAGDQLPEGLIPPGDREKDTKKYQLVACVTGKPKTKRSDCVFDGGNVLDLYDGRVEVELYEAATGKLVEKQSFKASAGTCPSTFAFYIEREKRIGRVDPPFLQYIKKLEGG